MNQKTRCYNVIKVICTILVVLAHVTRFYTGAQPIVPQIGSNLLKLVTNFIYAFHMPLFFIVSGLVYGYCIEIGKYRDTKAFVIGKLKRLMIPYFIVGICFLAPIMVIVKFTNGTYLEYVWSGVIKALDPRHLWYVLSLFEIFLLYQLIGKLMKNNKKNKIILPISFVLLGMSSKFPAIFQLQNTFYYQFFFFVGILLNNHFDSLIKWINQYKFMIVFPIFILLLKIKIDFGIISNVIYAMMGSIAFIGICIFITNQNWFENKKLYQIVKKNSYGIYLFHPMIIYVCFYLVRNVSLNPYGLAMIVFVLAFLGSMVITVILRKSKLRFIIGEGK